MRSAFSCRRIIATSSGFGSITLMPNAGADEARCRGVTATGHACHPPRGSGQDRTKLGATGVVPHEVLVVPLRSADQSHASPMSAVILPPTKYAHKLSIAPAGRTRSRLELLE